MEEFVLHKYIACIKELFYSSKTKNINSYCSAWPKLNTKIGLHHPPPPTTHHKLFSQKGYCYDFEILHRVNTHKKNKIWGENKFGG